MNNLYAPSSISNRVNDTENSTSNSENDDSAISTENSINSSTDNETVSTSTACTCSVTTIWLMVFFVTFANSIIDVVVQQLYIDRICRITLMKSEDICRNLKKHNDLEKHIDEIAATYLTYRGLIETGLSIVISIFLGPWIDRNGFKWPMLVPHVGSFLSALFYLTFCDSSNVPPALLLISSLPIGIVGGEVAVQMCVYTFNVKSSSVKDRSFRIGLMDAAEGVGTGLGKVSGGLLYSIAGFPLVFFISALLYLSALLCGFTAVRTVNLEKEFQRQQRNRESDIDITNRNVIKDFLHSLFRDRSGRRRTWLLLLIFCVSMRTFAMYGEKNLYLYTRAKFSWNIQQFTMYQTVAYSISALAGVAVFCLLIKVFKLSDAITGIISTFGFFIGQIAFALAVSSWMLYIGAVFHNFAGLINIVLYSMVSKIVTQDELAKVFAGLYICKTLVPYFAVPIYNTVFSITITKFSGAQFLLSAGAAVILFFLFIYFYFTSDDATEEEQASLL